MGVVQPRGTRGVFSFIPAATVLWLPACLVLFAEPARTASQTELMQSEDIVRQLTPPPRTRGLVLVEDPVPVSVSFGNIHFELDSADLTPSALLQIDEIARALLDERLIGSRFEICGHTDARGSADHNLTLSAARAERVRAALVARGVAADRLIPHGHGENALLKQLDSTDQRQRRVEIVNLGT